MDTDSLILNVKTDDIYNYIAEDNEARFVAFIFERDTPLPKGENEKVFGLKKDKLGGQIMKEFVRLKVQKIYTYLKDNNDEDKKSKGTKKCVI